MNTSKICRVCKTDKPLSEFGKSNKTKDGLYNICKLCKNAYQRDNYHNGASKEHLLARETRLDLLAKGLQKCPNCQEVKPATMEYFRPHKASISGLKSFCRACENLISKEYHSLHPEKAYQRGKKYNAKHPERKRISYKKYYQSHVDLQKQRAKDYRLQNPEKAKAANSNWKLRNKPKVAELNAKWRTRVLNADGSYNADDLRQLYEEQNGLCGYCGIRLYWSIKRDVSVDHVNPISRGGSNNPDNLILCCMNCNCSKNAKTLEEWMKVRGW